MLKIAAVALLFLAGMALEASGAEGLSGVPMQEIDAGEILAKVQKGQPVEYDRIIVKGDLDLSRESLQKNITVPIRIKDSIFSGHVNFKGTTLKEPLDISGSNFTKDLSFREATFRDYAIFYGATFKGNADFNGASFNSYTSFEKVIFSGRTDFEEGAFSGDANFDMASFKSDANFEMAVIRGETRFMGTNFNGVASFMWATLNGTAYFGGATFKGSAHFRRLTFGGHAYFWNATFRDRADFWDATFGGDFIYFNGVTFSGNAEFPETTFSGHADFSEVTFSGDASFGRATFNRDARFGRATFSKNADFNVTTFSSDADFRGATFIGNSSFDAAEFNGNIEFGDARFENETSFFRILFKRPAYFENSSIESLNLTKAEYSRLHLHWDDITSLHFDEAAYLALIKNYNNLGWYGDANDCYYAYRNAVRENWQAASPPGFAASLSNLLDRLIDFGEWLLYGYGVRPTFPVAWSVGIILAFGLLFRQKRCLRKIVVEERIEDSEEGSDEVQIKTTARRAEISALDPILFSLFTFTSGFTSFLHPTIEYKLERCVRWAIFERLLGPFFLALVITTISKTYLIR